MIVDLTRLFSRIDKEVLVDEKISFTVKITIGKPIWQS